jgi:hypothetical protein
VLNVVSEYAAEITPIVEAEREALQALPVTPKEAEGE